MAEKINPKEIEVDFGEMKNDKMRNFRERIWFIKYWAEFMKRNSVDRWSRSQGEFIDAQFDMAQRFWEGLKKKDFEKYEELKAFRLRVRGKD